MPQVVQKPLPITALEFERAMDGLMGGLIDAHKINPTTPMAVAVSGGMDSMALLYLMLQLSKTWGFPLYALTVNHGLRPEAALEAKGVSNWCKTAGIPHKTLLWEHTGIKSRIQETARAKRYELLTSWCQSHRIPILLTAHHLEDQLETTAMRLLRGSTLRGLSGIQPLKDFNGIQLIRPLLNFRKDNLRATCAENQLPWFEDPSNQNTVYERVRLRHHMTQIQPLITPIQQSCSRFRQAYDQLLHQLLEQYFQIHPLGFATLDETLVKILPVTFLRDVLSTILDLINLRTYPPSGESLKQLANKLQNPKAIITVGGYRISKHKSHWYFIKEWKEGTPYTNPLLRFPEGSKALGEKGWQHLLTQYPELKDIPLPKRVLMASPALLNQADGTPMESMVCAYFVPHMDYLKKNYGISNDSRIYSFIFEATS